MKVACLVLAYGGAAVLARTLPLYRDAGWDVFIHLDPKGDRDAYLAALGDAAPLARLIDEPVAVYWGGYSMMLAEFKLIEAARRHGAYDKYLLVSDDAFPLLPPSALARHFDHAEEQITLWRQKPGSEFHNRYARFYCYDHPATMMRGHGSVSVEIDRAFEEKIADIAVLRRMGKKPLDVYFGNQFWALTNDTIEFILGIRDNDAHLVKSFEYSALPDETMIQSILGNYRFKSDVYRGPMHVEFPKGIGPKRFAKFSDLPLSVDHAAGFIRKFSPTDTELLDVMQRRLNAGKTIHGLLPEESSFEGPIFDEQDRAWRVVRLGAPATVPGACWHGLEQGGGRPFRWSAQDVITWSVAADLAGCERVRFFIPIAVDSNPGFAEGSLLEWRGKCRKLERSALGLMAEFELPAAPAGDSAQVITVKTPRPLSPYEVRGAPDKRPLGLCVYV